MLQQSRRYDISHVGGEVFTSMDEPSDKAQLWGELFKERERQFYRTELKEELACFSIKDTFQMNVRCLWQPHARNRFGTRTGPHVTLLHGFDYPLTTSWTWVKLGRPLYKKGFSVVMMDLPGFGRSKMNMDPAVKKEEWAHQDWHVICQTLDDLRVQSSHFVATGVTCGSLLRIMMRSPHTPEREHVWFNPCMDFDEVLGDHVAGPPPGAGKNWREIVRQQQRDALEKILKSARARIWSFHDKDHLSVDTLNMQSLLVETVDHPVLKRRCCVQEMSKADVSVCHVGATLPTSFLYMSKQLIAGIVNFFASRETGVNVVLTMPKYISPDPTIRSDVEWSAQLLIDRRDRVAGDPKKWGFPLPQAHEKNGDGANRSSVSSATSSEAEGLEDENPLKAIMRKSRPQTTSAAVQPSSGFAPVDPDVYGARAATALPRCLAKARWRAGQSAYDSVKWMNYSQAKHQVRDVRGRDQVTMLVNMKEAKKLTGSNELAYQYRTQLLSKLNPVQREFVWEHQSQQVEDKGDDDSDLSEQEGEQDFKSFSAARMAKSLSGVKKKDQPALTEGTRAGSASQTNSRTVSSLPAAGSNAGSAAGQSRRPSGAAAIADGGGEGPLSITAGSAGGNMRSKSNLSSNPEGNVRKGSNLAESGSIRALHHSATSPAVGASSKESTGAGMLMPKVARSKTSKDSSGAAAGQGELSMLSMPRAKTMTDFAKAVRSKSNLSSGGNGGNKRSRSNLSVDIREPAEEAG